MTSTMPDFLPLTRELLSALRLLLWLLAPLSRLMFAIHQQSMLHLPQPTSSGDQTSNTIKTHKTTASGTRSNPSSAAAKGKEERPGHVTLGSVPLLFNRNSTDTSMQQGEPFGKDDPEDRPDDGSTKGDHSLLSDDPTGITRGQGMERATTTTSQAHQPLVSTVLDRTLCALKSNLKTRNDYFDVLKNPDLHHGAISQTPF